MRVRRIISIYEYEEEDGSRTYDLRETFLRAGRDDSRYFDPAEAVKVTPGVITNILDRLIGDGPP